MVQKESRLELLKTYEVTGEDFSLLRLLNGVAPEVGLLKLIEAKIYLPVSNSHLELNKVRNGGIGKTIVGGSVADLVKEGEKYVVLRTMPSGVLVLDANGERVKSFDVRPEGKIIPIFPGSNYQKMHLSKGKLIIGKSITPNVQGGGSISWKANEAIVYSVDLKSEEVDVVVRRSDLKIRREQHSKSSLSFSVSENRIYFMTDDLNVVYVHAMNGDYLNTINIDFLNLRGGFKLKAMFVHEDVLSLIVRDEGFQETDLFRVGLDGRNFSKLRLPSGKRMSYDVMGNLLAYSEEINGQAIVKVFRVIDD